MPDKISLAESFDRALGLVAHKLSPRPLKVVILRSTCDAGVIKHLLLLFALEPSCVIGGATIYIYATEAQKVYVHVEKVDSSGSGIHGGAVLGLVNAFLNAVTIPKHLLAGKDESQTVQVHVCSKSHPQYLFPFSKHNSKKRSLEDSKLIEWWKKLLEAVHCKERYWYVPAAGMAIGDKIFQDDGSAWKKGWPYKTLDDVPDFFTDDPKTRLMNSENFIRKESSLTAFWNRLATGQECGSGKLLCFFVLTGVKYNLEDQLPMVENDRWDEIYDKMTDSHFGNDEDLAESSAKLLGAIGDVDGVATHVVSADETRFVRLKETSKRKVPINNIGFLVKKRKLP